MAPEKPSVEPSGQPTVRVHAPTEQPNPRTSDIDLLSTVEILQRLNSEDRTVPEAVSTVLPQLAIAVDRAVTALRAGGRIHYVGAGTSGRLAVLDAAELAPTFNAPREWFHAHQAGGNSAFGQAIENAEDDTEAGAASIRTQAQAGDFVLGLTASGRTPFVLAALGAAREVGASTALVCSNPGVDQGAADLLLAIDSGPEPIMGSTRMKAGTAQKLVLTSFSTAVMIRMGRTYSNLMVSMVATNAKLRGRTRAILQTATGASEDVCERALEASAGDLKTALVQLLAEVPPEKAADALETSQGRVRDALRALHGDSATS